MSDLVLQMASYFFYGLHSFLIFFNLLGWLHPKTRKANLITLFLTFGSWVLLGYWKGWGYCFLSDWHYQILRKLGEEDHPPNYVSLLIEKITGLSPDPDLVNWFTVGFALLALCLSLWTNLRKKT
jgi:hypothetical protein